MREVYGVTSLSKYALVLAGSVLFGVALFVASFVAVEFALTHFVSTDPTLLPPAYGVVVIDASFVIGTVLGLAGFVVFLCHFWPSRTSR